jgi:hypothetical protein
MKRLVVFVAAIVLGGSGSASADFTFGEPTKVGPPINSTFTDATPCISADGVTLYFTSNRPGGCGSLDLWVAKRDSIDQSWSDPENLGKSINTSAAEGFPSISSDGLSLYYASDRPGGSGGGDIWMATRSSIEANWSEPINLGPNINSPNDELACCISPDNTELFICSTRPGGMGSSDLYVARRDTIDQQWSALVNLGPVVNGSAADGGMCLSSDNLTLFIHSDRPGGYGGGSDLYWTVRESKDAIWSEPINLGSIVNTSARELRPSLTSDARMLYFGGFYYDLGSDIWQVSIDPIVDFNGDGYVDTVDLVMMIENWNTNESLYDIGPLPWGDGVVDREDLEVLMGYWGQEIDNPTLIAHWALDETQDITAHDSAGENDGTLYGEPLWQPGGGVMKGALQLDGINDYMSTPFILNPASGKFSVFAWVKGGAPGQAILSQQAGANWLLSDPTTGALSVELKSGGRSAKALYSDAIITDGIWHRVGFAWDGRNRSLYVDDMLVGEDTQQGLAACYGGLQIGCGKDMAAGTFWSGLIDDVRIYNRVVKP